MLQRVVVEAPAKINLFLEITGRRDDGYHLIDTVMQSVSLTDVVVIGLRPEPGIRVTCSRTGIPEDARNLAHKAAESFLAAIDIKPSGGLHIHIDKHIPHEAGLGGGSSDAAAVLVGMNRLYGESLNRESLLALALTLGADVPFALAGGCVRARGIGEEMTALAPLPDCRILIAKPSFGVSTREAYALCDSRESAVTRRPDDMLLALNSRDLAGAARAMYNVFESVVPGAEISASMLRCGAIGAALSGSGSAVAGIFAGEHEADSCAESLLPCVEERFVVAPIDHGARIIYES